MAHKQHRLYGSYWGMVTRCTNPNSKSYHQYGGRGVTICDRWLYGEDGMTGFRCWLADMGERPEGMTLDRYPDGTGPYSPGNCRWATAREQRINQSAEGKERQRVAASAAATLKWEAFRASSRPPLPTHCPDGHEYPADRRCRVCGRIKAAARLRAKGVPARNLKRNQIVSVQRPAITVRKRLDSERNTA